MILKSFLIHQLLFLLLLAYQSISFAKKNNEYDDEDNIFEKRSDNSENEAIRAIRDYIDILCINWGGHYYQLANNTHHNREILKTYLLHVSSLYTKVLHNYNHNNDEISRTIKNQFMTYIAPRMRNVTYFNVDNPIHDSPVVAQYSTRDRRLEIDDDSRRERWSHRPNHQPIDEFVPESELYRIIKLRVPYLVKRPMKPYTAWRYEKNSDSDSWPGFNIDEDIIWNHLIPYQELNYLFESYDRLWLRNNQGNLWYSDLLLLQLEIRLSKLVILRADLEINAPYTEDILGDDDYYIERAAAYNAWPGSKLFVGPTFEGLFPKPVSGYIPAAEKQILKEWFDRGNNLTRDILNFKKVSNSKQNRRDLLKLFERYVGLLHESGKIVSWGKSALQSSFDKYDVDQKSQKQEVLERLERTVSENVIRVEKNKLIAKEYVRLIRQGHLESDVHNNIHKELKPGGKISEELKNIQEKKLKEKIEEFFTGKKIFQHTFSGPKYSPTWQAIQRISRCTSKNLNVETIVCNQNILFDAQEKSIIDANTAFVGAFGLKLISSNNDEICGITRLQEYIRIDPVYLHNKNQDFKNVDEAYNEDAIEEIKRVILHSCFRVNDSNEKKVACTMKVVNDHWKECEKKI